MACIKELRFIGSTPAIQNGLSCLQETLSYSQGDKGVPVTLRNGGEGLQVSWNGEGAEILYDGKTALFRGLGLLRGMLEREETGTVRERSCFRTNGVMADCSRNHVLSVDGAKALLRYMAAMGLNMLMLYTEDTYQVEGEPYFGYMRGRYSERELREIDDYAFDLGIEVIPCIQSLGHLERLLQWDAFGAVRDNGAVLLADEPATYALLQKMLEAASRPFRSRRIHIGMDETWGLGKGRYLEKHGHCRPQDIYMRHLKQVVKIAGDIGLQPMMWGDMFFALAAEKQQVPLDNMDTSSVKGGGNPLYYNRHIRITEEIRQSIPDGVDIVYWDYYTLETEQYSAFIRMHKELSDRLTFAGGLHSWVGMAIDFDYMYAATTAALTACRQEGVREVFATAWQDDGAETDILQTLPGLQLYAEMGWNGCTDEAHMRRRFMECTGGDWDRFRLLGRIDAAPGRMPGATTRVSKCLLYNDPAMGLYDYHIRALPLNAHYARLAEELQPCCEGAWGWLFAVPQKLCEVLSQKAELGVRLEKAYRDGDRQALKRLAEEVIPDICRGLRELTALWERQWMRTGKPFGWETLNLRLGGSLARLESTARRVTMFLEGDATRLEEFEETRLPIDGDRQVDGLPPVLHWKRLVSAGIV